MNQKESYVKKPIIGDKKSRPPPKKDIPGVGNSLEIYLRNIACYPLLTPEEEKDLSSKAKTGDQRARKKLIVHNLKLVVSIAKHYRGWLLRASAFAFLDLIQNGNIGLMKAVEKFDPSLGYHFATYATWWIRQSILRNLCKDSRFIRIPVHSFGLISKIIKLNNREMDETGEPLTEEQLIQKLTPGRGKEKISEQAVKRALAVVYAGEPFSLDLSKKREDGSATLYRFIGVSDPLYEDSQTERLKLLKRLFKIACLTPREAEILQFRYGTRQGIYFIEPPLIAAEYKLRKRLAKGKEYTLKETGEQFSLTPERIRQIEAKAIRKLQHAAFKEKFIDREPEQKKQIRRVRKKLAKTRKKSSK